MNGHTNGRFNTARIAKAMKVAPTTRAIRAALAVSATVLALAGSGTALAGECSVSALNTVSCNGDFNYTLPDFLPTFDLTLIVGDSAPTTVTPAYGDEGILASWGGEVTVISYADISTEAADGVQLSSKYSATFSNYGSITTDATDDVYANAIDVYAKYGDAIVINDGDVLTYSNGVYDVTSVEAVSIYGNATVNNLENGTIGAYAYTGNATGVLAISLYGDATVDNDGSVAASSFGGNATGIEAISIFSDAAVNNTGHIEAYSIDGNTLGAFAYSIYGDASIDNSGDIVSGSKYGNAYGAYASTVYGSASVTNSGSIDATAYKYGGVAVGAAAYSVYGVADIVNSEYGTIHASSSGLFGSLAVGAYAGGGEVGRVTNYGSISAEAFSYYDVALAWGTQAEGGLGVNLNYGSITADATVAYGGLARAVGAFSYGYGTTIVNEGSIEATAYAGYGVAIAYGTQSFGLFNGVYNYGDIDASASTFYGYAMAMGVRSYGIDGTSVYNGETGTIAASASVYFGTANATGIDNFAYLYGAYVTNDGSVSAEASADYGYGFATGVSNIAYFLGEAVTANYGDISATASVVANYGYGIAEAIGVYNYAWLYGSSVVNNGSITAEASAGGYYAEGDPGYYNGNCVGSCNQVSAIGVSSRSFLSYYSSASIENGHYGDISAIVSVDTGYGQAIGALARAGVYGGPGGTFAYIGNEGSISASASGENAFLSSTGAFAFSVYGASVIVNSGDISASSTVDGAGFAYAVGASAFAAGGYYSSYYYPGSGAAVIANYGDISGTASTNMGYAISYGATTNGKYAEVYNAEGATISATSSIDTWGIASAIGVDAYAAKYSDVINAGSITAYASSHGTDTRISSAGATGVEQYSALFGAVSLTNYGDISAVAVANDVDSFFGGGAGATGVYQYGKYDATVSNFGDISGTATADLGIAASYGVFQKSKYIGEINNYAGGDISAVSTVGSLDGDYFGGRAIANGTRMAGSGTLLQYNGGDISASAYVSPDGEQLYSGLAYAWGTYMLGRGGEYDVVALDNAGGISAYAGAPYAEAFAYGAFLSGRYFTETTNSGDISAVASADHGFALAVGSYDYALASQYLGCDYYGCHYITVGGIAELNNQSGGSISAESSAYAGVAYSYGSVVIAAFDATTTNAGSISAVADAEYGAAYALGSLTRSFYGQASLDNSGEISAGAYADYGFAYSQGSAVFADYDDATTTNAGSISAVSGAGYGFAVAVGSLTRSFDAQSSLDNSGDISAVAYGDYAYARGAGVFGTYGDHYAASIVNSGSISATAYGYYASEAVGVLAVADHGKYTGESVQVINEAGGEISAAAYGYHDVSATAVSMFSYSFNSLWNYGDITASGDGYQVAVDSSYFATAGIYNYGTITGSIQTGKYSDYLYNGEGGVWNAVQASYFGAGDDVILNYGTINMSDAAIYLGTYSEYGNHFVNYGVVTVSGDNLIDMGGNDYVEALVPSLNPNPFYNYGTIDFQDGHADDTLTIVGDFAGDGDINVDVSAMHGTSDLLYIDGSVVDGTSTINPDVIDTPTSQFTEVPMVYVTGDSGASNFALGSVGMDLVNTFLTFDFSLISDVDATNATDDVYSLGIDVTGLSDPGTLAASVVPGVQSLANAHVGTWRQRMGVINKFEDSAFSMWARWFQNDGTINPEHTANNFGQGGNFNFDQKNTGVEVGADFAVNEQFSFGVMAAKSDGKQQLNSPGAGSTKIDADTYGVYGTWISNGWYVDGSYRWMNFTAKTTSVAGAYQVDGDAEIFNIETGYAWTLDSGLQIEPQLQYTQTNVSNVDPITVGQTTLQAEDGNSQVTRLGVAFRKSFGDAANGTLWTPYATLSSVWESDGKNDYSINGGDFTGRTSIDGNSGLLELGLTAQTGNWFVYGGVNWQDGGALDSFFGGQIGVRYTFGHAAPPPPPPAPAAPVKTCADLDDDGDGVNNCNDKCPGSVAGQAIGPDGCPVPLTIDLKGVNFDFDKATLRPDAVAILDEAISILGKYPELKVEVAGHTDSVGTEVYNQGLSERRAGTVYDYLASHGIGSDRMVGPIGYGETKPIAPNTNPDGSDNPEGRALNRRTELNVQN